MAITPEQVFAVLNDPEVDVTYQEFKVMVVSLKKRQMLLIAQAKEAAARAQGQQAQQSAEAVIQAAQSEAQAAQADLDAYLAGLAGQLG